MIIVTGMPGSGKDEFINVAKLRGLKDYHMGNVVRKFAKESNVGISDSEIGSFATGERKKHGMDIWAERTSECVEDPSGAIIDGLRNNEELEYFRKNFPDVMVVAIFANRKDRLERIIKRDRDDDVRSLEELVSRDNRELSWGLGNVISLADYMIVNDKSLEKFKKDVNDFISDNIVKS